MNSSDWQRVRPVFEALMELPADRRVGALDEELADDPRLRAEVDRAVRIVDRPSLVAAFQADRQVDETSLAAEHDDGPGNLGALDGQALEGRSGVDEGEGIRDGRHVGPAR